MGHDMYDRSAKRRDSIERLKRGGKPTPLDLVFIRMGIRLGLFGGGIVRDIGTSIISISALADE